MFTSSAITLLIFNRIEQVLLPVLRYHVSVLPKVIRCAAHLQYGFCFQRTLCASETLVLLTLHHLQRQTGPEAQPASYTMGTGPFPWVKRPGRGVDHPPHLASRLRKE